MTRRFKGMMTGERYCASNRTGQVHDLDNEKYLCRIDHILNTRDDRPFTSLSEAIERGYGLCPLCFGHAYARPVAGSTDNDVQSPRGTYHCQNP